MEKSQKIMEAKGLLKVYGQGETRIEALQSISLSIEQGEIVSIMGPSGCGKTTLLNCLSGIDTTSRGVIYFEEQLLSSYSEQKRDQLRAQQMGFVFQSYNLVPVLSAIENVELPLLCQGIPVKTAREKALTVLERVGLLERMNHLPAQLSLGQQQRVALARSIVNKPKIVWADEPTGALDRQTTDMVLDLIEHLNSKEKITFVIVTHDPKVAERGNRVLYMDSGRILQERIIPKKQALEEWNGSDWS